MLEYEKRNWIHLLKRYKYHKNPSLDDMTDWRIQRNCIVCGKEMTIIVKKNGEYSPGHYFGKVEVPIGEGENQPIGKTRLIDMEIDIVEWSGEFKEVEYWECEDCFNEDRISVSPN